MSASVALERAVINLWGGICLLALPGCTVYAETTVQRADEGMGGSKILNDPANLIPACTPCHTARTDAYQIVLNGLEERGLHVRHMATNEQTLARVRQTPVEGLDGERFFLLADREQNGRWVLGRLNVQELMREGAH